ncbi:RNA polymerase sigma-70 factor, ECF subfamily [bacterium A37T11]|nr:RNA polymerase sigma-70 factor, ECF subfamily [bacterium A37T11]
MRYISKPRFVSLEEALEACAVHNDERGKEFIYKKYYGYVMAVILRYVKNTFDAEELTNESFMRAFKNADRFKGSSSDEHAYEKSFRAWLARIAANISIDHLRAQKHLLSLDDVAETDYNSLKVNASDQLQVADILNLLNNLPEIQRVIFNMFEIEGYSHEEIASHLNIPESTSRTYLTRAKQKLRKLYLDSVATPLDEEGRYKDE